MRKARVNNVGRSFSILLDATIKINAVKRNQCGRMINVRCFANSLFKGRKIKDINPSPLNLLETLLAYGFVVEQEKLSYVLDALFISVTCKYRPLLC